MCRGFLKLVSEGRFEAGEKGEVTKIDPPSRNGKAPRLIKLCDTPHCVNPDHYEWSTGILQIPSVQVDEMKTMWAQGKDIEEIGDHIGKSPSTVRKYLQAAGVYFSTHSKDVEKRLESVRSQIHETEDGHWLWTGVFATKTEKNQWFPKIVFRNETYHVGGFLLTFMKNQPRPSDDHYVVTTCDHPGCIHPDHIAWVHIDEIDIDKYHNPTNPQSRYKLSWEDVASIPDKLLMGLSISDIAEGFGVSTVKVTELINNKSTQQKKGFAPYINYDQIKKLVDSEEKSEEKLVESEEIATIKKKLKKYRERLLTV